MVTAPAPASHEVRADEPAPPAADALAEAENLAEGEQEDLGFGRAVLIGSAVGIVAMVALIAVAVHLLAPDWPMGAVVGIALWTGIWAGLFLGGTITVGRWSATRH